MRENSWRRKQRGEESNAGLVFELRKEIMDVLVCSAVGAAGKDLENKSWRLERGEKGQV